MLATIGAPDINTLFDEIPNDLRCGELTAIPEGLSEYEVTRLMHARAKQDRPLQCFAGGGAYEHHIPAAVWEITTRGEYYSAYTPYQAEASQGTLQLLYEYQSMMTALTAMDVSNASLYDGASALAEAILMAVRANRKSKSRKVLVAGAINPTYLKVTNAIIKNQGIELVELAIDSATGQLPAERLAEHTGEDFAALVVQSPNYFGVLEQVHELSDWAHANKALLIAVVNPVSLGILTPPGEWGEAGADIVCGEGQPLGVPLSSGGPYFGFLCAKQAYVRQMPGRIIGRTVDMDGKTGFALTLQAREQHIRRSKATSNICTNQGLMVTAATIYMSIIGAQGIENIAAACYANTQQLVNKLTAIDGVEAVFADSPHFHECVLRLPVPADQLITKMAEQGILAGVSLASHYSDHEHNLLVCATETKTEADLEAFANSLASTLTSLKGNSLAGAAA